MGKEVSPLARRFALVVSKELYEEFFALVESGHNAFLEVVKKKGKIAAAMELGAAEGLERIAVWLEKCQQTPDGMVGVMVPALDLQRVKLVMSMLHARCTKLVVESGDALVQFDTAIKDIEEAMSKQ